MNALDEITRVFSLEIDTLAEVRDSLGPAYGEAVDLIFNCQGKVVATGMGKSGLIAQKIAATMVSTGTSAAFLHPSDGLHGDVGIVRPGDVVLAVSKSGESEELRDLLPYVRKVGVPVISITAYPESTLGQGSSVVLFTPVRKEACPLDLAPTSSTTAAMVVGDALAMTLMKMRGFTPERFAELHPGGQLGKRLLMKVADIMRSGTDNPKVNFSSVRNYGAGDHRPPSQSSKTVLSTVHVGGPGWARTINFGLIRSQLLPVCDNYRQIPYTLNVETYIRRKAQLSASGHKPLEAAHLSESVLHHPGRKRWCLTQVK